MHKEDYRDIFLFFTRTSGLNIITTISKELFYKTKTKNYMIEVLFIVTRHVFRSFPMDCTDMVLFCYTDDAL